MSEKTYTIHYKGQDTGPINGIEFSDHDENGVRTAENVSFEDAERFSRIPGYQCVPPIGEEEKPVGGAPDESAKPIGEMTAWELVQHVKDNPGEWESVLDMENQREKPRARVIKAVEEAHASLSEPEDEQ